MSEQKKFKIPKGLIIYLIAVPIFFLIFGLIRSRGSVNWSFFPLALLMLLFLDAIPLLIYLCIYVYYRSNLGLKQKKKSLIGLISLIIAMLFCFVVIPDINGGGSSSNNTKTCSSCHRTFERYDDWGNLDDDYSNIQLRGMCDRCYENYKSTHGK